MSALTIAEELGVEFDVVDYMKDRPTREVLEAIVAALEDPVADLVRKDSLFKKLALDEADYVTPGPVVELLLARPALLQRPIVVHDGRAIIGRPKERIRALLSP